MGKNGNFQFKQFSVQNINSAMKVGTDGVLLGAWADVRKRKYILDVGTGTGVIALIVAQRELGADIDAVELDEISSEEASLNFKNSPWSQRLTCYNMSFQQYAINSEKKYDLIVSNPPFFRNSLKTPLQRRTNARHEEQLPFNELLKGVNSLLLDNGVFSLILPISEFDFFCTLAETVGLYLCRNTVVFPNKTKKSHRHLLEFSKMPGLVRNEVLYIEQSERGAYSKEYIQLTSPFYLNL